MKKKARLYARELIRLVEKLDYKETQWLVEKFAIGLIGRGQASLLEQVLESVKEAPEAGEEAVEIESAIALPKEEVKRLKETLSNKLGASLALQTRIKPELLGGLVIRHRDMLYDGSLKRRLNVLKQALTQ